MKKNASHIIFSPSDLSNHLSCKHLTELNKKAVLGLLNRPVYTNRVLEMLRDKGLQFEAHFLQELEKGGKSIVKISQENLNAASDTLAAMKNGVDVIYQGRLKEEGLWEGWADFIMKVDSPSQLGNYSYEVLDTKLATETRAGTILQIALYSEKIGFIQGIMPVNMRVQNPDGEINYRVDDYISYVRLAKKRLMDALKMDQQTYPDAIIHCDICNWWETCNSRRRDDDYLGFIAGMGSSQIREVKSHGINTLEEMAKLPLPIPFIPNRGAVETYTKLREQARVQYTGRTENRNVYEVLDFLPEKGLNRLPVPTRYDIYLDLEGDPLVEPDGLEYLFGWYCEETYYSVWVFNEAEEKAAFELFMDFAAEKFENNPLLHIYHYAPYETTAFKRLMSKYATREQEMDAFLRGGKFIDLYGVVRQSLRASVEKYSIKDLEKFYGYVRAMDLRVLSKIKVEFELLLETGNYEDASIEMKNGIQTYNQDDCISTFYLHKWLESIRNQQTEAGAMLTRPEPKAVEPTEVIQAFTERVTPVFNGLLEGISPLREERNAVEQGKYLLAHMLNWYRREKKSFWWEYYKLLEMPPEELLNERHAMANLIYKNERVQVKRSFVETYTFPYQECDLKLNAQLIDQDGNKVGTVDAFDYVKRIIKIKKAKNFDGVHPTAIFMNENIDLTDKENAMVNMAIWALENGLDSPLSDYKAGRDLLLRKLPGTLEQIIQTDNTLERAKDWSKKLNQSVLAIQGPPGTGKSFTASNMIVELVRNHKKVGVTALSHKVISALLEKVKEKSDELGMNIKILQKKTLLPEEVAPWDVVSDNKLMRANIPSYQVIAGTSFMWCRPEFEDTLDYLFVDEAGQLALIDTLAISKACKNIILLGDPQQLKQPQQGVHPEGTEVSALEHFVQNSQTISNEQGVFLKETWRMHPSICSFDSELFYENKLNAQADLIRQEIQGNTKFKGSGLFLVPANHTGNTSASMEEVDIIARIVNDLTKGDVKFQDAGNKTSVLTKNNIKIISPYNAQVQKLSERLPDVSVGTVDKFQGQEAMVIIYSVATSSPEDAPRGMDFLYSPNRFNVAVSRARAMFIMVSAPSIFEPDCKSPDQIKLANPFCRFTELAQVIDDI